MLCILRSSQWREAMRSCTSTAEESFTGQSTLMTPMRMLIQKFPDIAEFVLDKCYKEVKIDSEVCIEMNFEFVEDTFNYQKKEIPSHSRSMNPFKMMQQEHTFHHFTNSDKTDERNEGYEEPYTKDYEMVTRNHPMVIMAENSREELLRHPLCLALVRKKWMGYGKQTFIFLYLIPYLIFLTFLTTYVLTSPNPINYPEFYNCSQFFRNQTGPKLNETNMQEGTVNIASRWGIWVFIAFFLAIDVLQGTHVVLIKAVVYWDLPWAIVINYVLYVLVLYVTIQGKVGYNILGILGSLHNTSALRSVCKC